MIPRQVLAILAKSSGVHAAQRIEPTSTVREWDATALPYKLKLPARPFRPGELAPFVTVHVSDVVGGFGVSKARDRHWSKVGAGILPGATSFESALLERYRGVAYHRLASRRLGVVRNHPASLRTSHGNAGNKGLGVAVDCGHAEELSPELVAAGFRAVTGAIEECFLACGSDSPVSVVPHAVWSGKRAVDTDARVWAAIVLPAVVALGPDVCRIDLDACDRSKGGRPLREIKWARGLVG